MNEFRVFRRHSHFVLNYPNKRGSLTDQTVWTIKNMTGFTMRIESVKGGQRDTWYLYSNNSYVLAGLSGKQSNESSTIESILDYFTLSKGEIVKDFTTPLCDTEKWSSLYNQNLIGNKNTQTYTYEIKSSDL